MFLLLCGKRPKTITFHVFLHSAAKQSMKILCIFDLGRRYFHSEMKRKHAFLLHFTHLIVSLQAETRKQDEYDCRFRKNAEKNHCLHEHTAVEQDAAAGRDVQIGPHHQAQYETSGVRAEHDSRTSCRSTQGIMKSE